MIMLISRLHNQVVCTLKLLQFKNISKYEFSLIRSVTNIMFFVYFAIKKNNEQEWFVAVWLFGFSYLSQLLPIVWK